MVMSDNDKHFYELTKHKSLEINDKWFIINRTWFERWAKVVHGSIDSDKLPQILNNGLLDDNEIKKELLLSQNYEVVPEEVWRYLVDTYGLDCENENLFQRFVIYDHDSYIVEVEPLKLTISIYGKENKVMKQFSRCKTLNDIYTYVIEKFAVTKPVRIMQKMDNGTYDLVKLDDNVCLGDAGLSSDEHIYIDYKDTDGEWMMTKLKHKSATKIIGVTNTRQSDGRVMGVCGLCNLGNTCFMNSAIQCISNVPPLTYYFTKDDWRKDLNVSNPLGMHGRLADRYYQLLDQIWIKGSNYVVPRDFKVEVAKFAPQFSGYAQHDSQELMMFLLDGLHEDLNRIRKKPYQETSDSDDKHVGEKAAEAWAYHQARNDSIIVENFHGLLKSTVVCPDCNYVSITFDPFSSLSLPLVQTYPQEFTIKFWDSTKRVKAKVLVTKSESIQYFCGKIKEMFPDSQKYNLIVTEVSSNRLNKTYLNRDSVNCLKDADMVMVYELPHQSDTDEWIQVNMRTFDGLLFGYPFMVPVCKTDIDWYSLKTRLFQRLPFINRIVGEKGLIISDGLDPKLIKIEFEKISLILKIYLCEKNTQKSFVITPEMSSRQLAPQGRYEIIIEWSQEGKQKYYPETYDEVEEHISCQVKNKSLNIEACVDEFIKKEKLGINDLWYCKKCKDQKAATKKFDLWKMPKVLILHLKRFRSGYYRRDKIDAFVEFPLTDLNLSRFVDEAHVGDKNIVHDDVYDLVAVSNHMGGLGGGHYTAFAKNFFDNNWYLFDDSHTSKLSPDSVQTKAAYVLVYVTQSTLSTTKNLLNLDMNGDDSNDSSMMDCSQ